MKTLYVPIAPSGAGKSTYLAMMKKSDPNLEVFSLDELRHRWYDAVDYRRAWEKSTEDKQFAEKANKEFLAILNRGQNVYVDNTNLSKKRRRFYLDEAKRRGFRTVAIVFPTTLKTLLDRQKTRGDKTVPDMAVKQQYYSLQLPSFGEFDEVVSV